MSIYRLYRDGEPARYRRDGRLAEDMIPQNSRFASGFDDLEDARSAMLLHIGFSLHDDLKGPDRPSDEDLAAIWANPKEFTQTGPNEWECVLPHCTYTVSDIAA